MRASQTALHQYFNPEYALWLLKFFKHKDQFIGVKIPQIRAVAKQFKELSMQETIQLVKSEIHEERMLALFIWRNQYQRRPDAIYGAYLEHIHCVNNWDLVDGSAPYIPGDYLLDKDPAPLFAWSDSSSLWLRRISLVSTYAWIKKERLDLTLRLVEKLLQDPEDLIHKAAGWMLREVGKKNQELLEIFIKKHFKRMPRTMLRYAIERFEYSKRRSLLEL
jgi:3-methyladenine DNA glycosylase AlkD